MERKLSLLLSLFALASSLSELNAYTLFRARQHPQARIGLVWVKKDKGIQYALLARAQEQGEQRGHADLYSYAELDGKLPHSAKLWAQDDALAIYERHVSAWYKPKYRRLTYTWVRMDAFKKAINKAAQDGEFNGVTVKTRSQDAEGGQNEVELDPVFVQVMSLTPSA